MPVSPAPGRPRQGIDRDLMPALPNSEFQTSPRWNMKLYSRRGGGGGGGGEGGITETERRKEEDRKGGKKRERSL